MNTIKFSSADKGRTETSDVRNFGVSKLKIDKEEFDYYDDAMISLYVTKDCNGNCPFCMNHFENRFLKCRELKDKEYFSALEKYLILFSKKKPRITITGGEPTKSGRLPDILKLLRQYDYDIRTFSTNGSGLLDEYNGKKVIQTLLDNQVLHNISISRMAIDDLENSKIMGISVSDSNNFFLKKIALFGNGYDMELRISCNLLESSVSSLEDILKFKNHYNQLGYSAVIFRELVPNTLEEERVEITAILEEINRNKEFIYLKTLKGHYYTVYVYQYHDEIVKCYLENEVGEELIREFVIYPDGVLNNGFSEQKIMEVINE